MAESPRKLSVELTPEQLNDLKTNAGFNVRGSNGEIYRIVRVRNENNVLGMNKFGAIRALGCNPVPLRPASLRDYTDAWSSNDRYIAQKIFIECDAECFIHSACSESLTFISQLELRNDYDGAI